jgi:hypothetical protein
MLPDACDRHQHAIERPDLPFVRRVRPACVDGMSTNLVKPPAVVGCEA